MTPVERPGRVRALYLSYDGMCDPLGRSQVLPYLCALSKRGHQITLVSFEKPTRSRREMEAVHEMCNASGVSWHPLRYHKQPLVLSTLYDVWELGRLARQLDNKLRFDLVHCRSYVTSIVGLRMKRERGTGFIFDMRGFWADEKLEAGAWPQSNPLFRGIYSYFKRKEAEFLREADCVVSLTEKAKSVVISRTADLARRRPVAVIPCCVDFDLFKLATSKDRVASRRELGLPRSTKVLVYLGSLGGNYLLGEMLDFFVAFRRREGDARFLFVTHTPPEEILAAAALKGIPEGQVLVRQASRSEVPNLLAAADLGIAFKRASFSAKACSPTKLGEMLALGLPVVTNAGVGDVEEVMNDIGAGPILRTLNDTAYETALDELTDLLLSAQSRRRAARRRFDLEEGVAQYDNVYATFSGHAENGAELHPGRVIVPLVTRTPTEPTGFHWSEMVRSYVGGIVIGARFPVGQFRPTENDDGTLVI